MRTSNSVMRETGGMSSMRQSKNALHPKMYNESFSNKFAEQMIDETQDERFMDSIYDFNKSKNIIRTKLFES